MDVANVHLVCSQCYVPNHTQKRMKKQKLSQREVIHDSINLIKLREKIDDNDWNTVELWIPKFSSLVLSTSSTNDISDMNVLHQCIFHDAPVPILKKIMEIESDLMLSKTKHGNYPIHFAAKYASAQLFSYVMSMSKDEHVRAQNNEQLLPVHMIQNNRYKDDSDPKSITMKF